MPTSTQLTVTRENITDGLYGALFVSELQQSDNPTTNMVAEAITRTMHRFGTDGCAGQWRKSSAITPTRPSNGCAGCASSLSRPAWQIARQP